eukprot:3673919-Pyramimonas_sp.AAC.1
MAQLQSARPAAAGVAREEPVRGDKLLALRHALRVSFLRVGGDGVGLQERLSAGSCRLEAP